METQLEQEKLRVKDLENTISELLDKLKEAKDPKQLEERRNVMYDLRKQILQ